MTHTKALEDLIGQIAAIKWNGGYDRNGSHDAGEYVDYEEAIGEVLSHDQMHAVAEWISAQLAEQDALIQKHLSTLTSLEAAVKERNAQLAAERAMADRLAVSMARIKSDVVLFKLANAPSDTILKICADEMREDLAAYQEHKATRQPNKESE